MADFSGKIISAQYIDAEYTIIKVVYDDNGVPTVYNVDVNPDNSDFQELEAEGWTPEKIIEETAEIKRAQAAAFNTEVQFAARILAQEMVGAGQLEDEIKDKQKKLLELDQSLKIKTKSLNTELYEHIYEENVNKEELFKCKLWALELEEVKAADKSVKSSIRKANRITEVMKIVDSLVE